MTYVDPTLGVHERRSQLVAWGFGHRDCEWCVEEEGREEKGGGDEGEGEGEDEQKSDRIWMTWRESSRQDWASCNQIYGAVFSESFHTVYTDGHW